MIFGVPSFSETSINQTIVEITKDMSWGMPSKRVNCTFRVQLHPESPIARWFIMEHPIKIDDLGVPPFSETSISYESSRWCTNIPVSTSFHSVHQNSLSLSAWLTSPIFASVQLYDMKTRIQTPDKPWNLQVWCIFPANHVVLPDNLASKSSTLLTLAGDTHLESKRRNRTPKHEGHWC